MKTTIKASSKEIYTTWLKSEGHSIMTGGSAKITNKVGSSFSAWDGYIEGKNIVLEPFGRIVQSWRTTQFDASDEDSRIELLLEEIDGQTELTLIHTNLPDDSEHYINGWDEHYFQPMKAYFGSF
ncbi:MAG: hypothetical protein HKN76_12510 [Saprospiraceae bacterium]|nr:hypothetical protein [Saprospiraceae bacterium]